MDRRCEAESMRRPFFVSEGLLQGTEQTAASRNSRHHGPELAQELMPRLDSDAALVRANHG